MVGKIHLIGAGPGDPELLTMRALRLLQSADVVVHDRLVSAEVMELVPAHVQRIAVGKASGFHPVPQPRINRILIDLGRAGRVVARLKGGDPMIFGRGGEEAEALAEAGIPWDYTPGITAAQGVAMGGAAAGGIPLTHRGLATGLRLVTGHRAGDGPLDLDWASLADPSTTLAVYMGAASWPEISRNLMAHGLGPDLPVLAVSRATTRHECRVLGTLADMGARLDSQPMPAPVMFLIGAVAGLETALPAMPMAQDSAVQVAMHYG